MTMRDDPAGASAISPTLRFTAVALAALFACILSGSIVAKTEIVARGKGRIVAAGRTQSIQPQFEGQVAAIQVRDGDFVRGGDVLLRLDPTQIESESDRLLADLRRQKRERWLSDALLQAILASDPAMGEFPQALGREGGAAEPDDQAMEIARSTFVALQSQLREIDSESAQVAALLATQDSRIARARTEFELVAERNRGAENLAGQGAISRTTFLDRMRETRAVEADLAIARDQRSELAARLQLVRDKRKRMIDERIAEWRKAVGEADIAIAALDAALAAARQKLANTELRSPLSGRIENVTIHTVGGFVKAGETVMTVVPADSPLEIEAFFENRDVGFLGEGQAAFVKLDAFPAERFGIVTGRVLSIGADARQIEDVPGWVYASRIAFDRPGVADGDRLLPFAPGMTGTVDVITGERRLISYFFEPVVKAIQDGLGER